VFTALVSGFAGSGGFKWIPRIVFVWDSTGFPTLRRDLLSVEKETKGILFPYVQAQLYIISGTSHRHKKQIKKERKHDQRAGFRNTPSNKPFTTKSTGGATGRITRLLMERYLDKKTYKNNA